jgi:hypothetical protein
MREIDCQQMLWLIALCIIASLTALFVDESVFAIQNGKCPVLFDLTIYLNFYTVKLEYRSNYFIWMLSSLFFAFCG